MDNAPCLRSLFLAALRRENGALKRTEPVTTDLALGIMTLAFAAMGAGAIAFPGLVLGQFGIDALTREARNEVRAVYGGFGLAVSAL